MLRLIRLGSPLLLLLSFTFLFLNPPIASSSLPVADDALQISHGPRSHHPRGWTTLEQTVQAEADTFPGRFSVVAEDLVTGERFTYGEAERYLPASTMKVAVALCTARLVEQGGQTWETPMAFTPDDIDPDEPTDMADWPFGTTYTLRELVTNALAFSSNVAMHMLTRILTPEGLLACTEQLGGPVTRGPEGSTPVTAGDVAAWWRGVWDLSGRAPDQAEVLLQAMRSATYTDRIAAGTPYPELVTHKFGSVDDYFHDGAIVWSARPYLLVVLTGEAGEGEADAAIARLAAAAWAGHE